MVSLRDEFTHELKGYFTEYKNAGNSFLAMEDSFCDGNCAAGKPLKIFIGNKTKDYFALRFNTIEHTLINAAICKISKYHMFNINGGADNPF